MKEKSDFFYEQSLVVGPRRAGLTILEISYLLGFSHTASSRLYKKLSEKETKIWHKQHEIMEPSCIVSMNQAGAAGDVIV